MFLPVPPKRESDPARRSPDTEPRLLKLEEPRPFSVRRGVSGAVIGAGGASGLAVALPFGFWVVGWDFPGVRSDDLDFAIRNPVLLAGPVLASAIFGACAGWASSAPPQRRGFVRSLVLVFLAVVVVWSAGIGLGLAPAHYKGIADRVLYPHLVAFIAVPPLIAAAVLTVVRLEGTRIRPAAETRSAPTGPAA